MRNAALAVLLLAATGALAAPEAARLAEARSLIRTLDVEKQLDSMMKSMGGMMAAQLAQGPSARNPRIGEIAMQEGMALMKEQVLRPGGTLDLVAEMYAEKFTVEELRQIRAFHESPVGRKMQQFGPELAQRVMQESMKTSRGIATKLCERTKARLAAEKLPDSDMKCPAP